MKYVYFVAYTDVQSFGFGSAEVTTAKRMTSLEVIREIEKTIVEGTSRRVIIHNYQLLRKTWW